MTDKEREDLILVLQRILKLLEEQRVRQDALALRISEAFERYAEAIRG